MLEIDCSDGEGGGQVLRTALSVSCVLGKPVGISNIRAGRDPPGLRAQHLSACKLLAKISGAEMTGAELGSQRIVFKPGIISGGEYFFDIGTAGSCILLLQAALPVLLHSKKECTLAVRGGTHVRGAPTYEYFSEVFLPAISEFGARASAGMKRAGFYPKGGGEVVLRTKPSSLHGVAFSKGEDSQAHYSIISSGLPQHVAKREEEKVLEMLSAHKPAGKVLEASAECAGNSLTLWSGLFGASCLGERGKSAEMVAKEACSFFLGEIKAGACVDSHLADQLLAYAALAKGGSFFSTPRFTGHLSTNAEVLRAMTGRNIILGAKDEVRVI